MKRKRSRRGFKRRGFKVFFKRKRRKGSKRRFMSMRLSKGKRRRGYRIARGGIML